MKKKGKGIDLLPYMIAFSSISIAILLIVIGSRGLIGQFHIASILCIIAGLLFEGKRIIESWKGLFTTILGSFSLSFFSFFPGRNESSYDFESHLMIWPYTFILFFAIFVMVMKNDSIISKLTEGITLIQSIAFLYWVAAIGISNFTGILIFPLIIGVILSLFSMINAFTYIQLTQKIRLILSLWSSFIMLVFAVDYILGVYDNGDVEFSGNLIDGVTIGLQYFLLGTSSIYFVQNFFMLIQYLPGRDNFFNKRYFKDLKKLNKMHVSRYSDSQCSIVYSIVFLLFSVIILGFNYYLNVFPRNTAIWLLFAMSPMILKISSISDIKKTTANIR